MEGILERIAHLFELFFKELPADSADEAGKVNPDPMRFYSLGPLLFWELKKIDA